MLQTAKRLLCFSVLIGFGLVIGTADARWHIPASNAPQAVQDWYRNAELTPRSQYRFAFKKCCEHADVVKTQFRVNRANGGDEWYWLDGTNWRRVPDDIIHWGETAPMK